MAKRRKRMKLPNGFGTIKYLGEGRRNPYAVYPPVTEYTATSPVTPKALGYRETWEDAYELLTAYNMEKKGQIRIGSGIFIDRSPTFAAAYEDFFKEKYRKELAAGSKKTSSMYSTQAAFKNSSAIHNMQMAQIRYKDLQDVINSCKLKHASLELIVTLFHQMFKYALKYDLVDKDYSAALYIPIEDDDESGEPFSIKELELLWKNKGDDVVDMLLIMCYSGYRIAAYTDMKVNLEEKYFFGGVKSKYSRERTVPIHSAIYGFVCNRPSKNLLGCSASEFRNRMYEKLEALGIAATKDGKKHTPHDCRHTFSMLCEKYMVNDNDRRRMLGHSFGNDITNAVYGHRTLEDLRIEIEKIKTPL